MSKYTEILEFFMENGVQLDREQMNELKSVCESKNSGVANRIIKDRAEKAKNLEHRAYALKQIDTDAAKSRSQETMAKAKDIDTIKDIPYTYNDGISWVDHKNDTASAKDLAINGSDSKTRSARRAVKEKYGAGKKNMPEDREPGTYLAAQKSINYTK